MVEVTEPLVVREQAPAELDETGRMLMRAAEIVREGWCQNALHRAGSYCALGAVMAAGGGDVGEFTWNDAGVGAYSSLTRSLGRYDIAPWNNAPGRTAEEVAEALERAAIGA